MHHSSNRIETMTEKEMLRWRMTNQLISAGKRKKPEEVVQWMGAMQAQEEAQSRWAIGCRMIQATNDVVEKAIAKKKIVRTWSLRGTLHVMAASDIHWLLPLVAPPAIARITALCRKQDLDEAGIAAALRAMEKLLSNGRQLTRKELFEALESRKINTKGLRGSFILNLAALRGIICLGTLKGKQETYTLLEEWIPPTKSIARDEALALLVQRYFTGHGPATLHDFAYWSGLGVTEAKKGLEMVKPSLVQFTLDNQPYWMFQHQPEPATAANSIFLLPGFDEYFLGYKHRSLLANEAYAANIASNNGIFKPLIVQNGKIMGTWQRTIHRNNEVTIDTRFFDKAVPKKQLQDAIQAYISFIEQEAA